MRPGKSGGIVVLDAKSTRVDARVPAVAAITACEVVRAHAGALAAIATVVT